MQSFKTSDGTIWTIDVDIPALRRVQRQLDIDLLKIYDFGSDLLQRIQHPILLCDVLFVLCKSQADSMQVTDEKFAKLLGNSIEEAAAALIDAVTDFFPNPIERENMKKVVQAMRVAAEQRLQIVTETLDAKLEKAIKQTLSGLGAPATSTPASSA